MTRDRSRPRRRSRGRSTLTATLAALSLTAAGGCVVVHGEREVLPAATESEAAKALRDFTAAYNAADRSYDGSRDAGHVTGALADIDAARLQAGRANHPGGNPAHTPLELTDARFTVVAKAGWPRWFVADARGNKGGDARWLLVFTREHRDAPWAVAYLTLVAPGKVPEFETDPDGHAQPVPADSAELAVAPKDLSRAYVTYLEEGGRTFADGTHTSGWRELREGNARRPGLVRQYIDEPLTGGAYAPLALRTAGGGALVFFASRHFEKQTAAAGASVPAPDDDVLALTTGEIKQSLTMEFVSNGAVLDPVGGTDTPLEMLGRIQGLTTAKGE